jgi:hypothetical protein
MLVLLAITALAQFLIVHNLNRRSFDLPLTNAHEPCLAIINYLPMSLATQEAAHKYEKFKKQKEGSSDGGADDDEIDLFSRTSELDISLARFAVILSRASAVRSVRKRTKKSSKQANSDWDSPQAKFTGESSSLHDLLEGVDSPKTSDETIADEKGIEAGQDFYPMKSLDSIASEAPSRSKISPMSRISRKRDSKMKGKRSRRGKNWFFDRHPALSPAMDMFPDDLDDSDEDEVHAFDHPSIYVEQSWIWIPKDHLGLSELLVKELQDAGINASDLGAEMQENGIVEVTRNPPDEEWTGGHDA